MKWLRLERNDNMRSSYKSPEKTIMDNAELYFISFFGALLLVSVASDMEEVVDEEDEEDEAGEEASTLCFLLEVPSISM